MGAQGGHRQRLAIELAPAAVFIEPVDQDHPLAAAPAIGLDRKGMGQAGEIEAGGLGFAGNQREGRGNRHACLCQPLLGLELLVDPLDRFTRVEAGNQGIAAVHSEHRHRQFPLAAAAKRDISERRRPL
jgi:hypothetical protein